MTDTTNPQPDEPTPLRWGLNDVMWGDDDTVTVLLSGPDSEPYWLELDPDRAAVLREDLAGPDGEAAPADRAAILREAADAYDAIIDKSTGKGADPRYWSGVHDVAVGLRAMADAASGPGGVAGEASSYADRVNAPLSTSTITALREQLASGDVPVRTVRRRVAGETQQPETCGRTWSTSGDEYPPCTRPVDHREAYCRSADGQSHFIGAADEQPAAAPQPDGEA